MYQHNAICGVKQLWRAYYHVQTRLQIFVKCSSSVCVMLASDGRQVTSLSKTSQVNIDSQ